jgi:hypothetical protein
MDELEMAAPDPIRGGAAKSGLCPKIEAAPQTYPYFRDRAVLLAQKAVPARYVAMAEPISLLHQPDD